MDIVSVKISAHERPTGADLVFTLQQSTSASPDAKCRGEHGLLRKRHKAQMIGSVHKLDPKEHWEPLCKTTQVLICLSLTQL